MKILLTGAGGQIGHDLIGTLSASGHDVISTDLAPRPPSHAHASGAKWKRLDVTDAEATIAMFSETKPDMVFHLAATLSARGERGPKPAPAAAPEAEAALAAALGEVRSQHHAAAIPLLRRALAAARAPVLSGVIPGSSTWAIRPRSVRVRSAG